MPRRPPPPPRARHKPRAGTPSPAQKLRAGTPSPAQTPRAGTPSPAHTRSALSAVRAHRGDTPWKGEAATGRFLAAALEGGREEDTRALTHGFHAYPARMHPAIARRLVAESRPGDVVLDPFCGGGTVLVEAVAAGRTAIGVDASPLAVRLARLKSAIWSGRDLDGLVERARRAAGGATDRARRSRGERLPGFDPRSFAPHVFRELHFLAEAIARGKGDAVTEALWLVLSSILVKVSERRSETAARTAPTRLAPGFTSRHFARKAEELATGLAALARAVPRGTPPARVLDGDARALPPLGVAAVHRVVSSPPYPGVYDYADHHALRGAFLGIDPAPIAGREIGARRDASTAGAGARWQADLDAVVAGLARALAPDGTIVLLCGDGVLEGRGVRADASVETAASRAGLAVRAVAWQERPAFSPEEKRALGRSKREVLIALAKRS